MFQVKATVVKVMGDTSIHPCHFDHKIGDEIIWTGAELKGRVCPAVLAPLTRKMADLYAAGPRWVDSEYYYPFFYSTASPLDPDMKKYDGIGFKPLLKNVEYPKYDMANLRDPRSFIYPPHGERNIMKDVELMCPDLRTALIFKLEAFDLAEDGDSITYFRRMMVMLSRLQNKPDTPKTEIINEFTKWEIENIHPVLSQVMIDMLVEELALMDYVKVKDEKVTVTDKGVKKFEAFKANLSKEEIEALNV